ncbi:unnamed protein product [Paramecium octaurelia]|uniref:Uncharacterized protein n=1 Tax=Paramecium octaurelia TaxID=43137 RepID=A0A8S1W0R1_PAROT|nr:unnamed protein product [Paramecium octaurelia]
MNCTYHFENQVSLICIAPHQCSCQRKLCVKCLLEHKVDIKQVMSIDEFPKMVLYKLKQFKVDQESEIIVQKNIVKLVLSLTQIIMNQIWVQLFESINQIYDFNRKQKQIIFQSYQHKYQHCQFMVSILEEKNLRDRIDEKNSYFSKLQVEQLKWEQEVKQFQEMLKEKIMTSIQPIQEMLKVYKRKEDLYSVLSYSKNIDGSFINKMMNLLKIEKITDCIEYLSNKQSREQPHLKCNYNILKNISEIDFKKLDGHSHLCQFNLLLS